jgi:hypothetical protein
MTTIQNISTPTIRINTKVIRKAALGALALAGAALAALTMTSDAFASVVNVTATAYFVVLVAAVVGIAALGARENSLESQKIQYDIR